MTRRKDSKRVTVKVTRNGHTHRGKPVAVGAEIHTSPQAARWMQERGHGHPRNEPPAAEAAAEPAAEARDGEGQGGDATSDEGSEDDEDPASSTAGESFAGETQAAPAGTRAQRPGFLGRFGEV